MSLTESAKLVEVASLTFLGPAAREIANAGTRDERLGTDLVTRSARLAVAAWAMACDGDDTTLLSISEPGPVHWLMHPSMERWHVGPNPKVTSIEISRLEAGADPPELHLKFAFTGRQLPSEPAGEDTYPAETEFVGLLTLVMTDPGNWPWQLRHGHVRTLNQFLGYVFERRTETPQEYTERTGSAEPAAPAAAVRTYRLVSGFAEHDEKIGDHAEVDVRRETPPTREEAEHLIWPAIDEVTEQRLGPGDWRPSMNWLDVIELLG